MGRGKMLVRGDLSQFWLVGGDPPQSPSPTRGNPGLTDILIEEIRCICKRSDEQVEVENETHEEELDMPDESVEDGYRLNGNEMSQSRADEQGFDHD